MKIKLYKYTPHIMSFIANPMLRATRAKDLNDPFELNPTREVVEHIVASRKPTPEVMEFYKDKKQFAKLITTYEKGIISLSECKDNLLMWSHYSNEHKGGVIEFTFELRNESHSRTPVQRGLFQSMADNNYRYGIVKYRKNRTLELSLLSGSGYEQTNQIIDEIAFIKSKDWMYEEEHRFLVNLSYCNKTLVEDTSLNRRELESYNLAVEQIDDFLAIPPQNKFKHDLSVFSAINQFMDRSEFMQFVSINTASVTGIYIGEKMWDEQEEDIIASRSKLEKFTNLNNNINVAKVHPDKYELDFVRLWES
ncbi:DUF2971 domain-containing protein [Psychromonas sp.]|nr:DUF2971 domain-containing protein [Psychromonas sp.]